LPDLTTLPAVLADFTAVLADDPSADAVLRRLGDQCTELLPVHGVGVLLRTEVGGLEAATASSEAGMAAERLEADLGEGPCSLAVASGEQVLVPDLEAEVERFPRFAPAALEVGIRSVHGLPMTVRSESIGSLNIIALEPLALSADEVAAAQLLADVAIALLANARRLEASETLARQLQTALDSRVLIEQAKGVLSERHGISLQDAFERIRRHARTGRQKVGEVAQGVLRGELEL
jgi:GAF domain-containing protein